MRQTSMINTAWLGGQLVHQGTGFSALTRHVLYAGHQHPQFHDCAARAAAHVTGDGECVCTRCTSCHAKY